MPVSKTPVVAGTVAQVQTQASTAIPGQAVHLPDSPQPTTSTATISLPKPTEKKD